jgi:hypothetical protein|tara:strand:+ start:500 stop:1342 length:843 start_codon:yes stop_codon:yes gene_type:complete
MNYNRLYIFILLIFTIIVAIINAKNHQENFNIVNRVNGVVRDIGGLGRKITGAVNSIPGTAKRITDTAIDIALAPGKAVIKDVNTTIKGIERDIKNLFSIIEQVFNKVKYFAELLIFLLERGVKCAKGAEKVNKNYKKRTENKLREIKDLYNKLQTCQKNPIKIPVTYWKNCVTQIGPFMKRLYEFSEILIKFYKEVLTYEELFPQGNNKQYCATAWKTVTTQSQALRYGQRCNTCFHLKSIMKLGLEELQEFAKVINKVFQVTQQIENQINQVANLIKI